MKKSSVAVLGLVFVTIVALAWALLSQSRNGASQPLSSEAGRIHHNMKVVIVVPVTVRAIASFVDAAKERLEAGGAEVITLSAEGDPSKFQSVLKAAILRKPNVIIAFGTQLTDTALGPQFKADLPPFIGSALSAPEKVPNLQSVGVAPPRKAKIAIISDSPREDIYVQSANVLCSLLPANRKYIGILYNESEINSKTTAESLRRAFEAQGATVHSGIVSSSQDVDKVAKSLILKGCASLVLPHDKYVLPQAGAVVKLAITDRPDDPILVFSLDDGVVRDSGVPLAVSVNYATLGMMTAETCLEVLAGKDPSQIPVRAPERASIYVNVDALSKAGVELPPNLQASVVIVEPKLLRD